MSKRIYNIREFAEYLKIGPTKDDDLHVVNFDCEKDIRLKSSPVTIDFYLLSIKPPLDKNPIRYKLLNDQTDSSYMYIDRPHNFLEWDISPPFSGYSIMINTKYLQKNVRDYSFPEYNNHEALFVTKDEEIIILDLFRKVENEFKKTNYSKKIIISYIHLILTYVKNFYDRQFDSRSGIYHKVIEDFYQNLEEYYSKDEEFSGIPSVAHFAKKSKLSPNYFGDLIKHFTGKPPLDHIHDYIISLAKEKLQNKLLSVREISYYLGFDYPNYFSRFFRKKTGLSPKSFRNHYYNQ